MPQKIEKIPTIRILESIRPDADRASESTLRYPNLSKTALKYTLSDGAMWREFLDTKDDLTEENKAERLAKYHIVKTAVRLNGASTRSEKQRWSERFTKHSIDLYGEPDAEVAVELLKRERASFEQMLENPHVSQSQLTWLLERYDQLGITSEEGSSKENESVNHVSEIVGGILRDRFSDIFNIFDEGDADDEIAPTEIEKLFNKALERLKQENSNWEGWRAVLSSGSNLSRVKQEIRVGEKRVPAKRKELSGLFAHEVLVHAQRKINGSKVNTELKKGLAGYLTTEEGIALLAESGVNQKMPEKIVDRYTDIALALGQVTGEQVQRKDLLLFATARNVMRMQAEQTDKDRQDDPDGSKLQVKAQRVQTETLHHVNRIYRGSLGNEHVGVFTKDAQYYEGIMKITNYFEEQLKQGRKSEEVFDYMMLGKFDPTNEKHEKYVESVVG